MYKILSFVFAFALLAQTGCKKVEGEGGTSKITGKITVQKYNSVGGLVGTPYDGFDEDVFIIYGADNTAVSDKVTTSYDGTFEFNYLQKGTYTIFVYEDCTTCGGGKQAVKTTVEITKKKSTSDIGTIQIKNY